MRLKLAFVTSLLGATVGAGVTLATIDLWLRGFSVAIFSGHNNRLLLLIVYGPVTIIAGFTATFVYRHTAYRRKLHAGLTMLLTFFFWLLILINSLNILK